MQVIYAENERTKNVVDELENEFIFIEEKIIPRMGGFHVIGMVKISLKTPVSFNYSRYLASEV